MSLRKLLGLEDSTLTDEEIMKYVEKGLQSHHLDVDLSDREHHIVLHLHEIDPARANYTSMFEESKS